MPICVRAVADFGNQNFRLSTNARSYCKILFTNLRKANEFAVAIKEAETLSLALNPLLLINIISGSAFFD